MLLSLSQPSTRLAVESHPRFCCWCCLHQLCMCSCTLESDQTEAADVLPKHTSSRVASRTKHFAMTLAIVLQQLGHPDYRPSLKFQHARPFDHHSQHAQRDHEISVQQFHVATAGAVREWSLRHELPLQPWLIPSQRGLPPREGQKP